MAKILVIDDRATDREFMVTLLKYTKHRVIEAADGAEALRLVQSEHPDLVISDVLLPKMDGYELVRQLRLNPSTAQTTVIFYTAVFSEREAQDFAKKSGVTRILTKPTDPEKILETIDEVLRVKGLTEISSLPAHFEDMHQELLIGKLLRQVEELHQSEERFRLLAENATDMVYRFRLLPTRAWEYVNPAIQVILGYQPQDYYADSELPFRIVHPESSDELELCLGGRRSAERAMQIRWIHKEGKTVWTEIRNTPIYSDDGELVALEGIARDITEPRRALEEIRQSRDELELRVQERTADLTKTNQALETEVEVRLRAERALHEQSRILETFFSSTITPWVFLDRNFNFIRVNKAYAKCCQRDISEFKGHNYFEFYPQEENEAIFKEVVDTKVPYQAVARPFDFPDHPEWGVTYWDWMLTPLLDGTGEVEFLVFSLNDVTGRKKAEDALKISEERLKHLSSKLLAAQEEERKRIAHELHDGLGQDLTTIKLRTDSMLHQVLKTGNKEIAEGLRNLASIAGRSIEESRRIQLALRPSILDDLGIIAALNWLCREFQSTYPGIRVNMEIDLEENQVLTDIKTVIFRISQEALNNIAKHSKAKLVSFHLRKPSTTIELTIRDDGQGFNIEEMLSVETSLRGLGLTSMKERAELSGGRFAIESIKGRGTGVLVSWKD